MDRGIEESRQEQWSRQSRVSTETKMILVLYLAALTSGELLTAFQHFTSGLVVHLIVLFLLLVHASVISRSNANLSRFLSALSLAPLLRILSLSLPLWNFAMLQWLGIISIPLLVACYATMRTLNLKPGDVGLRLSTRKDFPWQVAIGLAGIPLGFIEFGILRPSSWLSDYSVGSIAVALFAIIGATGIAEELIFRGIMQRCVTDLAGDRGIIYVAAIFGVLHVSFLSLADLVFVLMVALFFSTAVLKTGSISGVIAAHTLVNVTMYLMLPHYL